MFTSLAMLLILEIASLDIHLVVRMQVLQAKKVSEDTD